MSNHRGRCFSVGGALRFTLSGEGSMPDSVVAGSCARAIASPAAPLKPSS